MRGIRTDGIRTVDDLKDRCWIDEITECWHWREGRDTARVPKAWLPAAKRVVSLGTVIGWLAKGEIPPKGRFWHVHCETANCCNPGHRREGGRSEQMRAAKIKRTGVTVARIRETKRAASDLSQESAEQIRASSETLGVLAQRFGISVSYAGRVRSGECRSSAGLMTSSVFNWRP